MHHHLDPDRTHTFRRVDITASLHTNRDAHKETYDEAMKGYLKAACRAVVVVRNRLEGHELRVDGVDSDRTLLKLVKSNTWSTEIDHLVIPSCHLEAYDEAIAMYSMIASNMVELTTAEFRCFILNKWDWSRSFNQSTSSYLSG